MFFGMNSASVGSKVDEFDHSKNARNFYATFTSIIVYTVNRYAASVIKTFDEEKTTRPKSYDFCLFILSFIKYFLVKITSLMSLSYQKQSQSLSNNRYDIHLKYLVKEQA